MMKNEITTQDGRVIATNCKTFVAPTTDMFILRIWDSNFDKVHAMFNGTHRVVFKTFQDYWLNYRGGDVLEFLDDAEAM